MYPFQMSRLIFALVVLVVAANCTPVIINNSNIILCDICKMAVKIISPEADKTLDEVEQVSIPW